MRRLVAALVMATLALALTACGGGETPPTAAAPPAPAAAAPAAATAKPASNTDTLPVPTTVSKTNVLSPPEADVNGAFPVGLQTPKVIADNLTAHRPMLIFFYDPKQNTSDDEREEIDAVMAEYRGLIESLAFDITGALPDPVTGAAPKDKTAEQVALLTQDLKIGYTPYIVLVDKRGIMTGKYRGFVDRALLEREVLKAMQ